MMCLLVFRRKVFILLMMSSQALSLMTQQFLNSLSLALLIRVVQGEEEEQEGKGQQEREGQKGSY